MIAERNKNKAEYWVVERVRKKFKPKYRIAERDQNKV